MNVSRITPYAPPRFPCEEHGTQDALLVCPVCLALLEQERDDFAMSNRINQDALGWVKSVVMDDDMPAADRMATLRHHFERGTFPVELLRRIP